MLLRPGIDSEKRNRVLYNKLECEHFAHDDEENLGGRPPVFLLKYIGTKKTKRCPRQHTHMKST